MLWEIAIDTETDNNTLFESERKGFKHVGGSYTELTWLHVADQRDILLSKWEEAREFLKITAREREKHKGNKSSS